MENTMSYLNGSTKKLNLRFGDRVPPRANATAA
jgi:hypothetical protein